MKPNGKVNGKANNQLRRKEDFLDWKIDNLAQFAEECWAALQHEQEANKQLRSDLRDAMKVIRQGLGAQR